MVIKEKTKILTVRDCYDVIVAGGGIAGVAAALAAKRQGKRVLLIEREYALGGLATLGLVTIYLPICDGEGRQIVHGIGEELLQLSISKGAECSLPSAWEGYLAGKRVSRDKRQEHRCQCRFNASLFALLAEKKLQDEGVELLYGTLVADALVSRNKITHLVVENKSGRYAFGAHSVVDATGDADVARAAGAACGVFAQGNLLASWYYYGNEQSKNELHIMGAADIPDKQKTEEEIKRDRQRRFRGLDGHELSEQMTLSHKALLEHFLANGRLSDKHTLNAMATIPQVRMTRRITGPLVMRADALHTEFTDSVGLFSSWRKSGPVYELPFRTLYSVNIKNLIAAGRNISVTDELWDLTRVIPVCAVSGEAAGTAAAMSNDFARLSLRRLQAVLRKNGVKLHERQLPKR